MPDINELRRLLAAGQITEADLSRMNITGSFGEPAPQQNELAQMINPQPMSEQEQFAALPQEQQATAQLPVGSMRNEQTGKITYFGPQGAAPPGENFGATPYGSQAQLPQQRQPMRVSGFGGGMSTDLGTTDEAAPMMDYARGPAEIVGKGKGFYGTDGNIYIKGPNGTEKVMLGYDRDASYVAAKRDFERRKGELDISRGEQDIAQSQESILASQANRSRKEGPEKPPTGYRWKADGSGDYEPVPGGPAVKGENVKVTEAKDVLEILKLAEPLLDKSTGSYIGAAVDTGAQAFGKTTSGAEAAAQLRALQGALISKMPKMSGPQSDKDVQLYREMAGEIGDPTIPAPRKRAAMETIRAINERAAGVTPSAAQTSSTGRVEMSAPPPASAHKGKQMTAPDGTRYVSDGKNWMRR